MNDFSEVENKLRELRPLPASPGLFSRIERSLSDGSQTNASSEKVIRPDRFRLNWLSLSIALGAAAALLVFAVIDLKQPSKRGPAVAAVTPAPRVTSVPPASQFIPAGATEVVYNRRDEGLFFPSGSARPMRRLRSNTRETVQWHNPATGASLRVSYPSEQVELIPVSGQ
jgi:hypothetical protein